MMTTMINFISTLITAIDTALRWLVVIVLMVAVALTGLAITFFKALGRFEIWVVLKTLPTCNHPECEESRQRMRASSGRLSDAWRSDT
jgi:hypothetical protein